MKLFMHSQTFSGGTVEVWEGMSNFILHYTGHVITYTSQVFIFYL